MKKILKYLLIAGIVVLFGYPLYAQTVTESVTLTDIGFLQIEKDSTSSSVSYNYVGAEDLGTDTTTSFGVLHTYTFRQAIMLDGDALQPLLDLDYDLTITEVKIFYSVNGFWTNDYTFSIKRTNIPIRFWTEEYTPQLAEDDWVIIGGGSDIEENDLDYGSGSFTASNSFVDVLQDTYDGSNTEFIFMGALSDDEQEEDSHAHFEKDDFYILVTYQRPAEVLSATARNDYHDSDGGNIGVGVGGNPVSYDSPRSFTGYENQTLNLAAYDNQTIDGDQTVFNNTEAPEEKSLWRRTKGQNTLDFGKNNQTPSRTLVADDDGATFAAILRGKYTIARSDYSPEAGTNINSANVTVIEGNTITAPSTQTYGGKTYTFYEWSDGVTTNPRTINNPTSSLSPRYERPRS